jgi:hypothetical protein
MVIRKHMPDHFKFAPAVVTAGDRILTWDASLWSYNEEIQGVEGLYGGEDYTETTTFRNGAEIDRRICRDC